MVSTERITVDVDPEAHKAVDALAVVSFRLACGCYVRFPAIKDAGRPFELKNVGTKYPCDKHGGYQIITRAAFRLVGWAK